MPGILRPIAAAAAAVALLLTGCSRDVTGTAVVDTAAAGESTGAQDCTAVAAPLADIPSEAAGEPLLRIPIPDGWTRNTMMDSQIIRYAIVARNMSAGGFATNAVVTLESVRGSTETPEEIFGQNRENLVRMMGASDLSTDTNTTCGLPSETTQYTAPPMGVAPRRPVIMHAVVAQGDTATFLATLTIQTTDDDNPDYRRDAQEIVDGFQMVLPTS